MQPGSSTQGLTKCRIYYQNGGKQDFRSFDTSGRYEVKDPQAYGIRGLKKMVDKLQSQGLVKMALLYSSTDGKELERYQNGQWLASQA